MDLRSRARHAVRLLAARDANAHKAERRFAIANEAWAVWENLRHPNNPTLVFETTKIARRVHQYPPNWRELSDEALYALSWSR